MPCTAEADGPSLRGSHAGRCRIIHTPRCIDDTVSARADASSRPAGSPAENQYVSSPTFNFDNSFARELPMLYAAARPEPVATPRLVWFNTTLADELGLPTQVMDQA